MVSESRCESPYENLAMSLSLYIIKVIKRHYLTVIKVIALIFTAIFLIMSSVKILYLK